MVKAIWRGFLAWPIERKISVAVCVLAVALCAEFLHETRDTWRTAVAERIAEGKKPALKHKFQTGMWYGTLWTCGVLALAAATSRWWLRPLPDGFKPETVIRLKGNERLWFWVMVALALLVALLLRWPRMDESVYVDEEHTLRDYMHGEFVHEADGKPVFEPVEWGHEMWRNTMGNNHFLFSVASKVSMDVWRRATGARREAFDETAFRMPSLLAGLGSLVVLAVLLARIGFPDAGWLGAWLMALHPWHVRYSAEGRGYALMILCLLGALLCAVHALRTGQWRWWIGFGVMNYLVLGFFAGAVYVVAALNIALLVAIGVGVVRPSESPPWQIQATRWFVANMLTATLLLQTMLPWMLEMKSYIVDNPRVYGTMGADWYWNVASYLFTGMQWASDDPANPMIIELSEQWGTSGGFAVLILLGLLAGAGAVRLAARGGVGGRVVVAVFLLAGPLAVVHSIVGQRLLFTWYLLFLVPGVCAFLAVSVEGVTKQVLSCWLRVGLYAASLVGFALIVSDQLAVIACHPKEDFRKVVEIMRGEVDITGEAPSNTILGFSFTEAGIYDPHGVTIWSDRDVIRLMEQADREGRPLRIAYAHRAISLERRADIMKLLDNRDLFHEIAIVPGLEEQQFTHYVLEYRRGSWHDNQQSDDGR